MPDKTPIKTPDKTPLERMTDITRRLIKVPKSEMPKTQHSKKKR